MGRVQRTVFLVSAVILFIAAVSFAGQSVQSGSFIISGTSQGLAVFSADSRWIQTIPSLSSLAFVDRTGTALYAVNMDGTILSKYDLTTGAPLGAIPLDGQVVSAALDERSNRIYLLDQAHGSVQVIDAANYATIAEAGVAGATSMTFDGGSLYIATPTAIEILSAETLQASGRIENLDAPALAVLVDGEADRVVVQHEKFVSVYRSSDLRFAGYLPLEGHPQRIQLDTGRHLAYVLLSDEPDSIAVFDLKHLQPRDWLTMSNRAFNNRRVDASSFVIDPKSGRPLFLDTETQTFFGKADTTVPQAPVPMLTLPPGVTRYPDMHVNPNKDNGPQTVPAVGFDGSGNFVVTWSDDGGYDGNGQGVFARRFLVADPPVPAGDEFQVNVKTSGDQGSSTIAVADDGGFTILWRDSIDAGGDLGIDARMFNSDTTPKTSDIYVPNVSAGRQFMGSVTAGPFDGFIAAWSGPNSGDNSGRGALMRRFDGSGNPLCNETLVDTTLPGNTWATQTASNSKGQFVVVWRDDAADHIHARAYNADGTPVAATDVQAGPFATGAHNFDPAVAMKDDGSFLVGWRETSAGGIVGQWFNPDQTLNGLPFVVTSKKTGLQYATSIGMAPDGRYIAIWRDSGYSIDQIVGRMFDASGNPLGDDFWIPENITDDKFEPAVAMDDAGNVIGVYKDRGGITSIGATYLMVGAPPVPMSVTGSAPSILDRGQTATVALTGNGFEADATVTINDINITINSVTFVDSGHLDVNVTIGATAFFGFHDFTVVSGYRTALGPDLLEIRDAGGYPIPTVTGSDPVSALQNKTVVVDIAGTNFVHIPGMTASFGEGVTVNSLTYIDPLTMRANITISGSATVGVRDISITNPLSGTGTCTGCFEIIYNPTLFSDDFNTGAYDGWVPDKGTWTAASLALVGQSDNKATILSTTFAGCQICHIDVDVKRSANRYATVSVLGWYADNKNYVELIMNKDHGKWILKQRANGDVVAKLGASATIDIGVFYHVTMSFDGTNFNVLIDGVPKITLPAVGIVPSGTIGFRVKGTYGTFDNVEVMP